MHSESGYQLVGFTEQNCTSSNGPHCWVNIFQIIIKKSFSVFFGQNLRRTSVLDKLQNNLQLSALDTDVCLRVCVKFLEFSNLGSQHLATLF